MIEKILQDASAKTEIVQLCNWLNYAGDWRILKIVQERDNRYKKVLFKKPRSIYISKMVYIFIII